MGRTKEKTVCACLIFEGSWCTQLTRGAQWTRMSHACMSHTYIPSKCIKMSMFLAGIKLSLLFIINVTEHRCTIQPSSGWQVGDIITTGFKGKGEKKKKKTNNTSRLWNTIPGLVRVNTPNTDEQRHFNHHMPGSYLLSCITDDINRDRKQLPPWGIIPSMCPPACWEHRDNTLWK